MKIGILLPRSVAYPAISFDFMDGYHTALHFKNTNTVISTITDNVGFGGVEKEVFEKAESLLLNHNVDLIVAFIDFSVLPSLATLMQSANKLMVVVNPGANHHPNWDTSPNIIHLNLQLAFMSWLSGVAASQNNKKAINCTTYYDCGYFHNTAIFKAFINNGGLVQYNYVNKNVFNEIVDIEDLVNFKLTNDTNQLICTMDTQPSILFYEKLQQIKDSKVLELYVSSLMLQQTNDYPFVINGFTTWMPSFATKENEAFTKQYEEQSNKIPTIFSVLGYEAALICTSIFENCKGNYNKVDALLQHLKSATLNGPRGNLKLDSKTNFFEVDANKVTFLPNSAHPIIKNVINQKEEWENFTNEKIIGVYSSWTNTYLCY